MRYKLVSVAAAHQTTITLDKAMCEEIIDRLVIFRGSLERQKDMLQDSALFIGSFSINSELYSQVIKLIKEVEESISKTDQDLALLRKLSTKTDGKLTAADFERLGLDNQILRVSRVLDQIVIKGHGVIAELKVEVNLKKEYEELRKLIEAKERTIIMQGIVQLMDLINKGNIKRNDLRRIIIFIDTFSGKKDSLKEYLVVELGKAIIKSADKEKQERITRAIERISVKFDAQKLMFEKLREKLVEEYQGVSKLVNDAASLLISLAEIIVEIDSVENQEIETLLTQIKPFLTLENQSDLGTSEALQTKAASVEGRKDSLSLQQLLKVLEEKLMAIFRLLEERSKVLKCDFQIVNNDQNWEEIFG